MFSSMANGLASPIEIAMEISAMATLATPDVDPATETDMAKAAPADPVLVSRYAEALSAAGMSRAAFETILLELKEDVDVRVNDVIGIAVAYRGGGPRPRSKKHALEMIEKRFVEIVRDAKKSAIASRVRPW
jgi:hypothetical protein